MMETNSTSELEEQEGLLIVKIKKKKYNTLCF